MAWGEADTAASIPERFAQVVADRAEAVAIAGAGDPVRYAELDALSAAYAARIPDGAALPRSPAASRRCCSTTARR